MKPCHTTIYDTNAPIGEARLRVQGDEPTFTAYGGYHDAGDADRRTYHMDVTATLLTTYDRETKRFGTEVLDPRTAGFASGMFMHLARIMKPYRRRETGSIQRITFTMPCRSIC